MSWKYIKLDETIMISQIIRENLHIKRIWGIYAINVNQISKDVYEGIQCDVHLEFGDIDEAEQIRLSNQFHDAIRDDIITITIGLIEGAPSYPVPFQANGIDYDEIVDYYHKNPLFLN